MKPFFTIILATYNRATKIEKAIKSVINQTFTNWELIIVDDGSQDSTKKNLTQYKDIKNIFYILKKHDGVAIARNFGLKKAKGNYVTFIDSDDRYRKDHLEKHYNIIMKKKNIDLFYGGVKVNGSKFVPDFDHPEKKISVDNCKQAGTFFIKRSILQKLNGFPDLPFAEDYALYKKIKIQGYSIKRLNIKSYIYDRTSNDEITKNVRLYQ